VRAARWLLAAAAVSAAGCGREAPAPVVLVSVDTLRADHLGCYGYERPTSPALDRFAAESVLFADAVAPAPTTAPSHMSIFTSLYPPVHGVRNYSPDWPTAALSERLATLPEFMRDHGYFTAALTGGGNVAGQGFERGFDFYRSWFPGPDEEESRARSVARVLDAVRRCVRRSREEGKPLFLFLHHYLCHDPYLGGPPGIRRRFLTDPVPGLPVSLADLRGDAGWADMRERFFGPADLERPDHLAHYVALYDGGVLYSDAVFARIRRVLEEEGVYDKALIVFTSDHGEEFMEHRGILHEMLFRETLHVPLIVRFPGGERGGRTVSAPVRTLDIFPTIAACLGLEGDLPSVQGASLLEVADGGGAPGEAPLSFTPWDESLRIVDGEYVYGNHWSHGTGEWLFARDDLAESRNLAGELPRVAAAERLRALAAAENVRSLKERLAPEGPKPGAPLAPAVRERLRALGYLR